MDYGATNGLGNLNRVPVSTAGGPISPKHDTPRRSAIHGTEDAFEDTPISVQRCRCKNYENASTPTRGGFLRGLSRDR